MAADPHTRLVSILKIALPLFALGLLSTLFLFSSRIDPGDTIPFAEGEINERIRDQQVTGPFFSGVTTNNDEFAFTAEELNTNSAIGNEALNLSAQLQFANGGSLALVADRGEFNLERDLAVLHGDILIESSTGYRMYSNLITAQMTELYVSSPGEVRAIGPAGQLTAGSMLISTPLDTKNTQLLFSDGVKLIYHPKDNN